MLYPLESTLKELLTHRKRKMKWINRYDESKLIKKINNISIWKSFGNDVYGNEHYYCFKSHLVVNNNEQDCRNCKYYIRNIINDCYQIRCLGFIKELSVDNIMKADKPNINNIEGPSYLEMHSKHVGSYDWMKLEDLPLSYEDIDYTLIYSKDDNRVFFVNLKSFTLNKKIGLMIMPDGSIEDSPTSLNRYSNNLCWRICTISSFKINKDHIELLSKYIQ